MLLPEGLDAPGLVRLDSPPSRRYALENANVDDTFPCELVKLILDVRFWASEGELQTVTGYHAGEYGRLLESRIDLSIERHAAMVFQAALNVSGYPHQMRPQEISARLKDGYEQRIDEILSDR